MAAYSNDENVAECCGIIGHMPGAAHGARTAARIVCEAAFM